MASPQFAEADGSLDGKQDDVKFGDSISYTFFISNEGLTTLSDLVLKDSMVSRYAENDVAVSIIKKWWEVMYVRAL